MPSRRYHPYQQFTKGFLADRHTEYRNPRVLNLDDPLGHPALDMVAVAPVLRQMELDVSDGLRAMSLLSASLSAMMRDVETSIRLTTQVFQEVGHCRNLYS